jgi:hypothetical protein
MKQKAKEDRLHYLSHFKKNPEGKVKKIKDITFDTPLPEVPLNVSTSSSPSSFVTVIDLTTVMDSFRLSMIANIQNMVDKSLGKRVEGDDNVASGSKTVAPQTPSINSSAAQTINPQYGMLLNYFAGQTPPPPFGQNRPVRPMGPTGQTGADAMVTFPSSPEPIVTIPPIEAAYGRSGGNTSVAQGVPIMVPFVTGIGYGYAPNPQINSRLQHHTSGSYRQPNMMQSNASTTPMPTTIQEVINRFNANLAKQMKDDYGIEVKSKNLSYQNPYPSSFDSVPYTTGWRCLEFVKFNGDDRKTTSEHVSQYLAQLGEASATKEIRVRLFSLSLTGNAFSWFASLLVNSIHTWEQLEQKFHDHFYSGDNELRLSYLTSVRQKHDEPVTSYIRRSRETKNRCYNLVISERDLAELAFNGL